MIYGICSISCHSNPKHKITGNDTIYVSYYLHDFESSIGVTLEKISTDADKIEASEIIHLKKDEYNKIKKFIQSGIWKNSHDSRVVVQYRSKTISISGSADVSHNIRNYQVDSLIYLIKWRSGYYNTIQPEEINYLTLIKLYGKPQDYKYDRSISSNILGGMKKVALIKDD